MAEPGSVLWEHPEVSTKDSSYYTGSIDNIAGVLTDTSRIKSINQQVGWATFDISSLPDNPYQ